MYMYTYVLHMYGDNNYMYMFVHIHVQYFNVCMHPCVYTGWKVGGCLLILTVDSGSENFVAKTLTNLD